MPGARPRPEASPRRRPTAGTSSGDGSGVRRPIPAEPAWRSARGSAPDEQRPEPVPVDEAPPRVSLDPGDELTLLLHARQNRPYTPPVQDPLPSLLAHGHLGVLAPRLDGGHLDPRIDRHRISRNGEFDPRAPLLGGEDASARRDVTAQ